MLKSLSLYGVGPAKSLGPLTLAPRLNFFTGDNGLGKSFFLDIAWWALTRTWARGVMAEPQIGVDSPKLSYTYTKSTPGDFADTSLFQRVTQTWSVRQGRPPIPGVVIYAGVDGSFSAWDPARNYWSDKAAQQPDKPRAFNFSPESVWNGLESESGTRYCNGLIQDWVLWQKSADPSFSQLSEVLKALSPSPNENLQPGEPIRIGLDVKDYPSLRMPYGQDVALVHASAGMRRIVALAYLLVWTWREHQLACKKTGTNSAKEIVFLIDEIECHLHPQWQRRIVPALLNVMQALTGEDIPVQLIIATHSPLVMASVEPSFDVEKDAVFILQTEKGKVKIHDEVWAKQGDIVNWLVSDTFGLHQARSIEAEIAIEAAEAWMRGDLITLNPPLNSKESIHEELLRVLPGGDHFWARWIVSFEKSNEPNPQSDN